MVRSACATYVKLALMAFNFLCLMAGAFITYLGLRIANQADSIGKAIKVNMETRAIFIIILGGCVLALALLGFLGACCESAPLLYIYGGGMLLVLLSTITILYLDHPFEVKLKSALEAGIQNGLRKFNNDSAVARPLQFAQKLFECCGWNGPDDYKPILPNGRIPISCCGKMTFQEKGKAKQMCELKDIVFRTGCKATPILTKYTSKVKVPSMFLVLFEFILLCFTCFLGYKVGKKHDDSVSY